MAWTSADINGYAQSKGYLDANGVVKDEAAGWAIARDASQYGVTASQLDSALNLQPGRAQSWLSERGAGNLLPQTPAGGPPAAGQPALGQPQPLQAMMTPPVPVRPGSEGALPTAAQAPAPAAAPSPPVTAPTPAPTQSAYQAPALPNWATDPSQTAGALQAMAGATQGPATFAVTDNMLTSRQLERLLSSDSPYLTRARAKAAEYSNARGLINSSIGAGAGEAAAIDAAMPIAQSDAETYLTAGGAEFQAKNQFASDANNFQRQGALASLNQGFNLARDDLGYRFQSGERAADRTFQRDERLGTQDFTAVQNTADRDSRFGIANLQEQGADRRQSSQIRSNEGMTREGWANDRSETAAQRGFQQSENAAQRGFQQSENASQRTWQQAENALSRQTERDLTTMREDRTDARAQAQNDSGMLELYMNSLNRLQTDPSMSPEQKSEAIRNLGDFFFNQALPAYRQGLTDPANWPDVDMLISSSASAANPGGGNSSSGGNNTGPGGYESPGGGGGE